MKNYEEKSMSDNAREFFGCALLLGIAVLVLIIIDSVVGLCG